MTLLKVVQTSTAAAPPKGGIHQKIQADRSSGG